MTETLITISDAARLLGISERKIHRLVHAREIPFIELPTGDIRFDADDLRDWIVEFRVEIRRPPIGATSPVSVQV